MSMPYETPPDAWLGENLEARVLRVGEEYLDRLQSGKAPDHEEMIEAHPDLGAALERHLKLIELLHGARGF